MEKQSLSMAEFEHKHIQKWIAERRHGGFALSTIMQELILMRGYLRWLFECQLSPHPAEFYIHSLDFPKMPQVLPRALSPTIDQLLQQKFSHTECEGGLVFLLMRKTGLRVGELTHLAFDPIVNHGDDNYYLRVKPYKVPIERLVPLDFETVTIIKSIQNKTKSKVNPFILQNINRLIISREGNPYSIRMLQLWFKQITYEVRDEEGRNITSHQLRHTYATQLINAGMSLFSIMKILGHRTSTMTQRYAQVSPETIRREYLAAVIRIKSLIPETEKKLPNFEQQEADLTGQQALSDFSKWLKKKTMTASPSLQKRAHLIHKRIDKIHNEINLLEAELAQDF